jgi:hypothetical protein
MFYTPNAVTLKQGRGERGMVVKYLVEVGGRIPVEKFHVSCMYASELGKCSRRPALGYQRNFS